MALVVMAASFIGFIEKRSAKCAAAKRRRQGPALRAGLTARRPVWRKGGRYAVRVSIHADIPDPRVLHADVQLVVVDKPAGLLSVPGRGPDKADCALARVRRLFPDAQVVHRLDQASSGLLVFARGAAVQRALSIAFAERCVSKRYEAVVDGLIASEAGAIELPLSADWPNRPRQQVDSSHGRPALTRWSLLARDPAARRTRLELEPVTGRTHQLRVHMAALGHPIVGDRLYGTAAPIVSSKRLLLHATRLEFQHPGGGGPMCLHCAAPF
jgi:tRNA pseudouridine32 synthase/23S rRNA pseudouridine746 synthase